MSCTCTANAIHCNTGMYVSHSSHVMYMYSQFHTLQYRHVCQSFISCHVHAQPIPYIAIQACMSIIHLMSCTCTANSIHCNTGMYVSHSSQCHVHVQPIPYIAIQACMSIIHLMSCTCTANAIHYNTGMYVSHSSHVMYMYSQCHTLQYRHVCQSFISCHMYSHTVIHIGCVNEGLQMEYIQVMGLMPWTPL